MAKKMEISHPSQIFTNDCQILILSQLSNYCCTERFFDPDSEIAMAASCVKIITYVLPFYDKKYVKVNEFGNATH